MEQIKAVYSRFLAVSVFVFVVELSDPLYNFIEYKVLQQSNA